MQSIRIVIPDDVAKRLADLARQEYRAPRQQAAALLAEAVARADLREPLNGGRPSRNLL